MGVMQMKNNKNIKNQSTLKRVLKYLIEFYPVLLPVTGICIIFSAITATIPAFFYLVIIGIIEEWTKNGWAWESAAKKIIPLIIILASFYVVSMLAITLYTQLMAYITQGFLYKMRGKMFEGMQELPIKYFDTHKHGDIMSHYTNDVDAIRELVSRAIPSLLQSCVILISVFSIMIYFSIWLTLVVLVGVAAMLFVSKKIGGGSAKYFVRQQEAMGKTEGFVQEMMNGQKVIKVFCHEKECISDFDKINNQLYEDSKRANAYANTLGPIIMNIGNILYVIVAVVGSILLLAGAKNLSLSGMALGISIVVPFMNMTKQFTGNVNQVSQQINAIVMGLAGAKRIFSLMDEEPEVDNGYVTLVNAIVDEDGNITESEKRTGKWAWKHPHHDGTLTYTLLKGDVRLVDVDFAYEEGKNYKYTEFKYNVFGENLLYDEYSNTLSSPYKVSGKLADISFEGISKDEITYIGLTNVTVFKNDNNNMEIQNGEFVFIVGDSGSGKSTLIKLLLKENQSKQKLSMLN